MALAYALSQPGLQVEKSTGEFPADKITALLIRSSTKVDDSFLSQYPQLKVVISSTSGTDHLDLEALAERGVVAMHTPGANAASACELTWALILASHARTS